MRAFYRPEDGYVGDVIPFYWDGLFHAFYLKTPLEPDRDGANGVAYGHLVSSDMINWEVWPLAIEPGVPGSPDSQGCFTGSVIEKDGTFHMFYTGFTGQENPQSVCHAISDDLRTWEKNPDNPIILADTQWYEAHDWRDPYPFWNAEANEYWMLLAARLKSGPENRRGCIALITSPDLMQWEVQPPFWAPGLYVTHECPDLFRWEDHWVLVYSTYSERMVTHYRISTSLDGPWVAPATDTFDGRAFYAAKTVSDGKRRFALGWNPTRKDKSDTGAWEWAGNMVIHELTLQADGRITVNAPLEFTNLYSEEVALEAKTHFGHWEVQRNTYNTDYSDGFAAVTVCELPNRCLIEVAILSNRATRYCGILLRADPALAHYYELRWEPGRRRVVFDRWPRPGDEPFMLERPLEIEPGGSLLIKAIIEDSVITAYLNNEVALSCRAYDHRNGQFGLFVVEGAATFSEIRVRS